MISGLCCHRPNHVFESSVEPMAVCIGSETVVPTGKSCAVLS